jgi:hypothetical protein
MDATSTRRSISAAALAVTAVALPAFLSAPAAAQPNPTLPSIPQAMTQTVRAKITGIDAPARKIALQGADGRTVTVTAGPLVRLEMLKVGNTVTATFYRSVAFELSKQTTNAPPDGEVVALDRRAEGPGGVAVSLFRISGLVVGKDTVSNSLDVVNPTGGGVYTVQVTDPSRIAMLQEVKVGDVITAVISDTLAVSVE